MAAFLVVVLLALACTVRGQDCSFDSFTSQVNYTDTFIENAINQVSSNPNSRPLVAGSPWKVSADYTMFYYRHGGEFYIAKRYDETSIWGGSNIYANNTLYRIIVVAPALDYAHAYVYVHDSYGNCLINGYPYGQAFIDNAYSTDSTCEYHDLDGDYSADCLECYTGGSSVSRLGNLPAGWRWRDQKFSLMDLPYCVPLQEATFYANTTSNVYRLTNHIFFNVVFNDPNNPITMSSTCSNFPAPDSSVTVHEELVAALGRKSVRSLVGRRSM